MDSLRARVSREAQLKSQALKSLHEGAKDLGGDAHLADIADKPKALKSLKEGAKVLGSERKGKQPEKE